MEKLYSNRTIATPSPYAKEHYLYVQETGSLINTLPHISRRKDLDSFLLFFVLGGCGLFFYNHHPYPLKQGDCVWIDCRFPYAHESSKERPWELKWVHFYGKEAVTFYESFREQAHPFIFSPDNPGAFNEILSSIFSVHKEDHPLKELLCHKHLTDMITLCFTENTGAKLEDTATSSKFLAVRDYLKTHFSEDISLTLLSETFFISRFYLAREYKRIFGITIGNELTGLRISHAKSLLRFTSDSVGHIAFACGFHDTNYFIKCFKKTEGMTPLSYRKKW